MMNKKTSIILVLLIAFFAGEAMAQRGRKGRMKNKSPEERAEIKTKRMVKPLQLTADQTTKIKEVHLTAENALATVKADKKAGKITKEEAKAKRKEINKTRRQGLKSNLNDDQKAKYRKWKKRRKKRRKGKGRRGKGKNKDKDNTDTDDDDDDDDDDGK
ncbi:hypothetical protein BKI52_24775 [marine bacterium AO1-C]|nr:hypothetical protein BKI52_24775 [marine bacterium AO1-C]